MILDVNFKILIENSFVFDIVTDDNKFKIHLALKQIVEDNKTFCDRKNKKIKNEIDCKLLTSTTFQIAFLRKLEEKIKIEHLDIDYEKHNDILDQPFEDENILNAYLKTFPDASRKTPITTKRDVFEILVKGYNSIVPKLFDSIQGERKRVNKKLVRSPTTYKLNINLLKNHIDLIAIKNKYYDKIDDNVCSPKTNKII